MATFEKIIRKAKQHLIGLKLGAYDNLKPLFMGKIGLEIGGPSSIFKVDNILPIYADAKRIDGVNFSTFTVWENAIDEGLTYEYNGIQKGYQFILEASNLSTIQDNTYSFLLSSHSLEHCANVIKTLQEWKRVLSSDGLMVVVLPNKEFTFDCNRKVTNFSHLLDDYKNDVNESDLTHLEEILAHHELSKDPGVKNMEYFVNRSSKNHENRCLHHHVFDIDLLTQLFEYLDMKILFTDLQKPYHVIAIAQKLSNN